MKLEWWHIALIAAAFVCGCILGALVWRHMTRGKSLDRITTDCGKNRHTLVYVCTWMTKS